MKFVHASLETTHYSFDCYAKDQDESAHLLQQAWKRHSRKCGGNVAPFSYWADSVRYNHVELGQTYQDGDKI